MRHSTGAWDDRGVNDSELIGEVSSLTTWTWESTIGRDGVG
jgi:hypothetical protein